MRVPSSLREILLLLLTVAIVLPCRCPAGGVMADEDEESPPEFSAHLNADRTSFFYLADTAPVVRRFLKSDGGKRIVRKFSQGIGSQDAKALLREFDDSVSEFVPDQICLAASNKSIAGICELAPVGMYLGLCAGAVSSGETEKLDDLHPGLLDALKKIKVTDLDLWIRFRNEFVPTLIESQARSIVAEVAEDSDLDVEFELAGFSTTVKVKDFVPAALISGVIFSLGIADDLSDPDLAKAGEIIADMELTIRMRRVGPALLIQFGDPGPKKAARLQPSTGAMWADDGSMLMYTKYDLAEFRRALLEADELWQKYADTAVGEAAKELDSEDLLGDLRDVLEIFSNDVAGEIRLTLTDVLKLESQETGHQHVMSLGESGIANFIPESVDSYFVSTEYSLADLIRGTMSNFEDRLSSQSSRDEFEESPFETSPASQASEFYYSKLKDLRELIRYESPRVFVSPVAIVCESELETTTLTVSFEYEGDPNSITVTDVPVPAMAFIAKLGPESDVAAFGKKAQAAFLKAWEIKDDIQVMQDVTVDGIKMPVSALSHEWQKVLPNELEILSEGSPLFHSLVTPDGWMILSTSTQLTSKILKTTKSQTSHKLLTKDESAGSNLFVGSPLTLNNTFLLPLRSLRMISDEEIEMSAEGIFAEGFVEGFTGGLVNSQLGTVIDAMEAAVQEMTEIRMQTQHNNGTRTMQATISFSD